MTAVAEVKSFLPTLHAVLRERKSVRAFKPDPVPQRLLDELFALAAETPSNCNTQPWTVCLVSGATRDTLAQALTEDYQQGKIAFDIPYLAAHYPPGLKERQVAHVQSQQDAFGISRDDAQGRSKLGLGNMRFWDAPHVALLFMPAFGNEREAADVGMFAQSAMLGATALGLATCPQTSLGLFAGTIKRVLGIDDSLKLLIGLAIGYEDETSPAARLVQDRVPPSDFIRAYV